MKKHDHREHRLHQELSYEDHIVEEVPEKAPSLTKRVIVGVLGFILIVLMVSYIFAGFPLSGIIRGQLESSPLEGNQVVVDDVTLLFEQGTKDVIEGYYFSELETEFSLCLQGEVLPSLTGRVYSITSLYQPTQYEQTFNHVTFERCSEDTLVILHTHPYKSCVASGTDLNTLERSQEENPYMLMVVMCEPQRFSVYS